MGSIGIEILLISLIILFSILDRSFNPDFSVLVQLFSLFVVVWGLAMVIMITTPATNNAFIERTTITDIAIVPVNGYWLYNGKYVLQNNDRGEIDSSTIGQDDLSPDREMAVETKINYMKANFWHFAGKNKKTHLVINKKEGK
jgi:hypothetical protein